MQFPKNGKRLGSFPQKARGAGRNAMSRPSLRLGLPQATRLVRRQRRVCSGASVIKSWNHSIPFTPKKTTSSASVLLPASRRRHENGGKLPKRDLVNLGGR